MRQQLLGYLLGALESAEEDRVEEQLQQDPALCEQLEELDASLEPLRQQRSPYPAPKGLAQRTCQFVEREIEQSQVGLASAAGVVPETSSTGDRTRHWSLADMVTAGGVMTAMALLFFPAIANSRFQSQVTGCQDNLRLLHVALMQYADANHGFFPAVPGTGELSFAGIYGPLLHHGGYAVDPGLFHCPAVADSTHCKSLEIPTMLELQARHDRQLALLRRRAGGDYGYSLGTVVNGTYCGVRHRGRVHFAVMADAPSQSRAARQSINHAGHGQNVLFEDGHVHFLVKCQADFDNVFLSDRHLVEPGRHRDDAVLGYCTDSPAIYQVGLTTDSE